MGIKDEKAPFSVRRCQHWVERKGRGDALDKTSALSVPRRLARKVDTKHWLPDCARSRREVLANGRVEQWSGKFSPLFGRRGTMVLLTERHPGAMI
jgi:hypothetical protein